MKFISLVCGVRPHEANNHAHSQFLGTNMPTHRTRQALFIPGVSLPLGGKKTKTHHPPLSCPLTGPLTTGVLGKVHFRSNLSVNYANVTQTTKLFNSAPTMSGEADWGGYTNTAVKPANPLQGIGAIYW